VGRLPGPAPDQSRAADGTAEDDDALPSLGDGTARPRAEDGEARPRTEDGEARSRTEDREAPPRTEDGTAPQRVAGAWLGLVARRPWHVGVGAVAVGLGLGEAGGGVALVVAAVLLGTLAALRAPGLGAVGAVLVLAGSAAADVRLEAIDAPADRVRDGRPVTLRAHLLTPPRPNPFGASAEIRVTTGALRHARLLLRGARWAPLPRSLTIGEEVRVEGRLEALDASTGADPPPAAGSGEASSFDFDAYLRARGVAGELLLEEVRRTGRRRQGVPGALDRMRARAERAVVAGMPEPQGALLRGMVLGQDEAIDEAVREDFRDSGLAHLLAVSGQNVMLLAALALPVLALAGAGLRIRFAVLAGVIALYVPLAGAGPSLQRAGVMGLAGIAALSASRPASRWYALLLAAAATLAWNPRSWSDTGWQLSFAAVAGILTLGVPLQRTLRRAAEELIPAGGGAPARTASDQGGVRGQAAAEAGGLSSFYRYTRESRQAPSVGGAPPGPRLSVRPAVGAAARLLADGIAVTVAATLATAPLLAHHFGSVPLAGLPANLLALPAVAPAMWLGMLKIAVGQAGPLGAPPAAALGQIADLPVRYLAWLAERCSDLPGGQLTLPLRSPGAVLAAYAVLAGAALLARKTVRPLGPGLVERAARWRRLPRTRKLALATLLATALLAGGAEALDGPGPPGRLTVRFLDVGQGDATLVQHPDGTAVLFDGGPPEAGVARLLRKAGVERLALVVATHASRDHHGGLEDVIERFPVEALLDGGDGTADPSFRALVEGAADRGVQRLRATAPLAVNLAGGDLRIRLLSPPPRPPGPAPEDPNPRAVVALVTAGAFELLLTADAESESLLPLDLPDVDAMKVAHHGSADPGLPEVLDELEPEIAAIEVGPNTYGHPAPSTLNALDKAGVRTYRTDHHGTVTLTLDGGEIQVETER
jgi:competence protein ComEC